MRCDDVRMRENIIFKPRGDHSLVLTKNGTAEGARTFIVTPPFLGGLQLLMKKLCV